MSTSFAMILWLGLGFFLILLVWPFFAIGAMLKKLFMLSLRKREGDDDDPNE